MKKEQETKADRLGKYICLWIFVNGIMMGIMQGTVKNEDTANFIAFFLSIGVVLIIKKINDYKLELKKQKIRKELDEEDKYFKSLVEQHSKVLLHKKKIYLVPNEYGKVNREKWIAETDKFFKSVSDKTYEETSYNKELFSDFVEITLNELEPQTSSGMKFEDVVSGVDYEDYIQDIIEQEGFIVETTATIGDQGVDLIAYSDKKHDFKIAIQCKFYSKPVGNKAVQEVKAGMDFYECQLGCVCTNNEYTPSAKSLANKLDIALLNEDTILDYLKEKLDY